MNNTKLSICIPTYNRAPFLRYLLAKFVEQKAIDFPYEIVISDNASTDDTTMVVQEFATKGLPIRYYKREVNDGGWANLTNAYQYANGQYSLYLADDDLLIFENLRPAILYLDANPDVVVCHAPWFLYDAIDDKDGQPFYHIEKARRFSQRNFAALFSFITDRHIFPEIAIYRTDTLRSIVVPHEFCYWAFSYLAQAIDIGAVAFVEKPFYRSVTRTHVVRDREQGGHEETMTSWDRYRGGLEYFLYLGAKRGQIDLSGPNKAKYEQICSLFTLRRMAVALRMWVARKEYIKAYEIYARLCFNGLGRHPEVDKVRDKLPLMAGVQSLARKINAASNIRFLVLDKVADIESLGGLLFEMGLGQSVGVMPPPEKDVQQLTPVSAVFTSDGARRELFIRQGYRPGLIFCENDIVGSLPV
jgi:glycosyltransferase involved in cell wall biosynthesis